MTFDRYATNNCPATTDCPAVQPGDYQRPLDPVLVHHATQALDSTLSMVLFLAGLNCFAAATDAPSRTGPWVGAGVFWAAATLVRPNNLPVVVPAFAWALSGGWRQRARVLPAALSGVLLFGAAAAWQKRICGVADSCSWQGAYNLWSGTSGANGRYYTQLVSLQDALGVGQSRPRRIHLPLREGDPGKAAGHPLHERLLARKVPGGGGRAPRPLGGAHGEEGLRTPAQLGAVQQHERHHGIDDEQLDLRHQMNGGGSRDTDDSGAHQRALDRPHPADGDYRKASTITSTPIPSATAIFGAIIAPPSAPSIAPMTKVSV